MCSDIYKNINNKVKDYFKDRNSQLVYLTDIVENDISYSLVVKVLNSGKTYRFKYNYKTSSTNVESLSDQELIKIYS